MLMFFLQQVCFLEKKNHFQEEFYQSGCKNKFVSTNVFHYITYFIEGQNITQVSQFIRDCGTFANLVQACYLHYIL